MKKIFLNILLFAVCSSFGKNDYKYGKITIEELMEKAYKKDSLTGAVIKYSIGEYKVGLYTKREKIKIYDKNSLNLANQTLVLYNPKFSGDGIALYGIKGKTYNFENGKIVESELTKKEVRIDRLDDYHDIVHFAFTNVKEGSIIEYEIKINNVGLPTWYFQQYYPVEYSEFETTIPEFYKFRRDTKGYLNIPNPEEDFNTTNYNNVVNTWKMKDIPAFVKEPYMYCEDNYISQINHELLSIEFPYSMKHNFTTNWTEITKRLLDEPNHAKLLSISSGFMNSEYEKVKDIKDNLQRLDASYKAIQNKMSWDGTNSIFSFDIKTAYKETKGSVADINFLLLRLLKDCNIQAYPVILSTRSNGFMPLFPSFNKFNYLIVLAKVNGQSYLLDATEKYLSPNILPTRCLNGKGLIVKEGTNVEWIDLTPKQNFTLLNSTEIKISSDGIMKGKSTFKRNGYAALFARKELSKNINTNKPQWILENAKKEIEISNYSVTNKDSIDLPIIENFDFKIENNNIDNSNTILLEPILFEKMTENPFKSPDRIYPIEFQTPTDKTYIVNISLPENMTIEEKPKSISINMPDNSAKFIYSINAVGNVIQLNVKLNIKNTLYSQDQYPYLKEFYAQVISKLNEPILLQRK